MTIRQSTINFILKNDIFFFRKWKGKLFTWLRLRRKAVDLWWSSWKIVSIFFSLSWGYEFFFVKIVFLHICRQFCWYSQLKRLQKDKQSSKQNIWKMKKNPFLEFMEQKQNFPRKNLFGFCKNILSITLHLSSIKVMKVWNKWKMGL